MTASDHTEFYQPYSLPPSQNSQINLEISKPRRNRDYLKGLLSYEKPDLQAVQDDFHNWCTYDEYMLFRRDSDREAGLEYKAVLCAKRGNKVYSERVRRRLADLGSIPNVHWFNVSDRSKRVSTGGLFVSLTYRRGETLDRLWELLGEDFNRFTSAMRKRYGRILVFRCWEAQRDGTPHIHVIMFFLDREFEAFFHRGETNAWRIQDKDSIAELWPYGFSDVEALGSRRGGIRYVAKYLGKVHRALEGPPPELEGTSEEKDLGLTGLVTRGGEGGELTLALAWAMGRRSFSVSRAWLDLTSHVCNSNQGLPVQVDFGGDPVYRWVLVGFYGGDLGAWVKRISLKEYRELRSAPTWSDNRYLGGKPPKPEISGWDV